MPHAAEVQLLVLELDDPGNQRTSRQSFELRVRHRLAELAGERELLLRAQSLVAEEDDETIEESVADLRDDVALERARDVDAANLGAEPGCSRQRSAASMAIPAPTYHRRNPHGVPAEGARKQRL